LLIELNLFASVLVLIVCCVSEMEDSSLFIQIEHAISLLLIILSCFPLLCGWRRLC
jgi:hypothetical protein